MVYATRLFLIYAPRVRSVTLSNSVLSVSPSSHIDGSENGVVIQDSLNELLELVPAVSKLHRVNVLLKEHKWKEGHEDEEESFREVRTGDRSPTPHNGEV
jgi:sister chromatid cohesion protein DCC1